MGDHGRATQVERCRRPHAQWVQYLQGAHVTLLMGSARLRTLQMTVPALLPVGCGDKMACTPWRVVPKLMVYWNGTPFELQDLLVQTGVPNLRSVFPKYLAP